MLPESDDAKLRPPTSALRALDKLQLKPPSLVNESNATCIVLATVKVYFCCWPACPMLASTRVPSVNALVASVTGCMLKRQVDALVL